MTQAPFLLPLLPGTEEPCPWGHFGKLEHQAVTALARLSGMMIASAKADLFWITWLMKEAQCSNVIEGTVTTFDEIIGEGAGIVAPAARRDDILEVLNYREAMLDGLSEINQGRPLSLSFIKALHAKLLRQTRGMNKTPGEFRKKQVHIGYPGSSLNEAIFIPPEPVFLQELLDNWLQFISRDDLNPIIQTAVMHAQFEMIHPFLDGNGRMGRLLITLFLSSKGLLNAPCLYLSAYLQNHRSEYYRTLKRISSEGSWDPWIDFFLQSMIHHCNSNASLLMNMTKLYEESKQQFIQVTNSSFAISILDYIFANPIFSIPGIHKKYSQNMSKQVIVQLINKLQKESIVEKVSAGQGRKPAVYRFTRLMKLLD